jgi:hypothetical protein
LNSSTHRINSACACWHTSTSPSASDASNTASWHDRTPSAGGLTPSHVSSARSRHCTIGHGVTAGAGSRGKSLAHEQFAKIGRQRTASEARISDGRACAFLSPLSLLCGRGEPALCGHLSWRKPSGRFDSVLGRNARGALVVAANAKRAEGNTSGEDGDV